LFKLSPSIALAVLYLMSKICEWTILENPKKWVVYLGFFANISRKVWNIRLLFSPFYRTWWGLHNRCKKLGAVAENFPLGGAKRFDRRYVRTFILRVSLSVNCVFIIKLLH